MNAVVAVTGVLIAALTLATALTNRRATLRTIAASRAGTLQPRTVVAQLDGQIAAGSVVVHLALAGLTLILPGAIDAALDLARLT